MSANAIAQRFHEAYERLAPEYGYETRCESAVPWEEVPEKNRALMEAVVRDIGVEALLEAAKRVDDLSEGPIHDFDALWSACEELHRVIRRVETGQ